MYLNFQHTGIYILKTNVYNFKGVVVDTERYGQAYIMCICSVLIGH